MKKIQRVTYLLLIVFIAACCVLVKQDDATAMSYTDCINSSGGRGHIPSVQWACEGQANEGKQHCTLWLGPTTSSTSLTITADVGGLSGTISAAFYGMCTRGTATTSKIWAEGDNGSISTQYSLYRGEWGSPGSQTTTIDIGLFIQGLTPTISDDYMVYSRNIVIGRCHGTNTDSCSSQDQTVTIRIHAPSTTFECDESLTSVPSGTTLRNGVYYTDASSTSFTFSSKVKRNNDGKSGTVWNQWWLYQDGSGTAYENKGQNFSKNSGWVTVKNHARTVNLNQGDNYFSEKIGLNRTISYSGSGSNWGECNSSITVHRYIWYNWDGQVIPSASGASAAESGGILYVDANTANMSFSHQLKKSGGSVKTRYKTNRSNTPSTFPQQTNYTNTGLSSNNTFTEVYRSPASGTKTVNVAKDDGTQYCQTLNWYQYTREDRGDSDTGTDKIKTEKSTSGCKTIRRYKTTFSGTIKVEYKKPGDTNWTTIYSAGASEISPGSTDFKTLAIASENIPTDVEVRFTHTVTRSSSDAHGSPNTKTSFFTTDLTGTTGYRAGDAHGTAVTTKATTALSAGSSDTHVDTFTVKIYPEQEITLCQKLTYGSEIQGAENTQNSTAGRRCFKLTKSQVSCQGVQYGIKNAKNYITMQMYKNSVEDNTSGRLDTTKPDEMVTWAKPGDSVRFKYTMCAAGELASQFADKYITNYVINTNNGGYLFGKTVSDSPYTGVSKTIGTSNATPGVGPFPNGTSESHKYEYTTASPSDNADDMYKCAGSGMNDYYRIHDIRTNNASMDTAYINSRNNCNADDYGHISDVGQSFTQTATWSDIWYQNGTAVRGHTGGNATVTGRVNVPYNYFTEVKTTAAGGNVVLGQSVSAQVSLKIAKRTNAPVQAAEYATYSKQTKYRLVQVTISPTSTLSASTYNDAIKAQEYSITDSTGGANLATQLSYCRTRGVSCSVVANGGDQKLYYEGDNTFHNIAGSTVTVNIPDSNSGTYAVGTKICYVAAVWPSDSHGFANPSTVIDETNQAEALKETGSRWHVSSPSCFTVVKRPTLSSLGADLYAPAGILGVTTKRNSDRAGNKALFGSWSEFGLVSGTAKNTSAGEIKGFASGASLWGGGTTDNVTRTCYFSSMTFANSDCADGELGKVPINTASSSYPERLAAQIRTRYTDENNNAAKTNTAKIGVGGGCVYDPNSNTYVANYTDSNSKFICLPNGAKYTHATANVAYIDNDVQYCMVKGDTYNSRTAIIQADHTLIIGTNMVYGDIYNTERAGTVAGTGCYKQSYKTISEIPQMIVIADKIVIKENVTHIDSWLIANEIYTCDPRTGYNAINQNNNKLDKNMINATNCGKQLTINGPVITQKLNLFRTGGGDNWSNNGMPAEIFYLGPESYLWSYNQAQRFSQATTTYQRELAPRY